jgi:antitoxin component of MazEF toxin-antitoxin module
MKITAVKRSEDGKAIIIRGYNSSEQNTRASFESHFTIKQAFLSNLLEEAQESLIIQDNQVSFDLSGKKIFSLKLHIERIQLEFNDDCELVYEQNRQRELFDAFEYAPYVTEEDIQAEIDRAEELKPKSDHPMWRRTALEAQLSAILARNKFDERRITELGYGLNEARVQRRVYDYINQFKNPDDE